MVKKCSKCEIERNYSEFCKREKSKDGLMSWCKCCVKKYRQDNKERLNASSKQHYQENKDSIKERKKQHYQDNRERIIASSKQHYQENKERAIERNKQYYQENKERLLEYSKQYRQENKEYHKEYSKQYNQENKERIIEYKKQYNQDNRERVNEQKKQYTKKRRKTDPLFKMSGNLRNRTSYAFKCNGYRKNTKTQQMLGVSWEVCKAHIGNQFTKGMNWDNYGEWHIDHIIPLASANTEKELTTLCHYSNLKPLWAEDNLSKGSKIESQQIKLTI